MRLLRLADHPTKRSRTGSRGCAAARIFVSRGSHGPIRPFVRGPLGVVYTDVLLNVNGRDYRLNLDVRVTLLDALRETLGFARTKKGCDLGQCGACTVLIDGKRVLSRFVLAATVEGAVTTIEGLAGETEPLHPMQQAFIECDALQCGYCTPGQILSAIACVEEGHAGSEDEIREYMSGNLCRCAAYPKIVEAIMRAKPAMEAESPPVRKAA